VDHQHGIVFQDNVMVRFLLNGDGALLSCSYPTEQNEPRYNATSFHLIPPGRTQGPAAEVGVVRSAGRVAGPNSSLKQSSLSLPAGDLLKAYLPGSGVMEDAVMMAAESDPYGFECRDLSVRS
jgi:hypothetical protein